MDTLVGTSTGRYQIIRQVGQGGMSIVYAAFDQKLGREVALKVLKPEHTKGEAADRRRARLLREAHALELVSHPNVVRVFDVGTIGDRVFVSMELIEGWSLRDWLRVAQRSRAEIIDVYTAAGRGLEAAHAAGLVHRDFKPGNVLVGRDGRVVVTDFGLVRLGNANEEAPTRALPAGVEISGKTGLLGVPLTLPGAVLGTPGYMAPEQIQGRATDVRTDQFGFAVALYDALYGELPFAFDVDGLPPEIAVALEAVQGRVRPPPPGSDVPDSLRRVMLRALQVEPEDRFPAMSVLLDELARARGAAGIAARVEPARAIEPVRPPPISVEPARVVPVTDTRVRARRKSRGALIALIVSAVFLGLGGTAWWWVRATVADPCRVSEIARARLEVAGPAYLAEWTGVHGAVCLQGAGDPRVLSCLTQRLDELVLMERELANADPRVAGVLARGLPRPAECTRPPVDAARFSRFLEAARAVVRSDSAALDSLGPPELVAIGWVAISVERWKTAERAFEKATRALPENDPLLTGALHGHGVVLVSTSRAEEARLVLTRALMRAEQERGPSRADAAIAAVNLAAANVEAGEYHGALPLLERALPVLESAFGSSSDEVGEVLLAISVVRRHIDQLDAAQADLRRSIAVVRGPRLRARCLFALGDLLLARGRPEEARALLQEARQLAEAERLPASFSGDVIADLALAAQNLGDVARAETLAREARGRLEGLDDSAAKRAVIDEWLENGAER